MNIQDAKNEICHALRVYFRKDESGRYVYPSIRQRPILLMGPPGIGKTAVMEQAAAEAGVGLVAYTMTHHTRQSAIGLPHIETRVYQGHEVRVTEYTLSEIVAAVYGCMERTGKREGILFLDEINCVSETLAPTMLQLLQNKTFGNHRIPDGWLIAAAGNPPEFNRSVRDFDVVTLDRVRQIDIEPDLDVWLDYARRKRLHGAVTSYLSIRNDQFYQVKRSPDGLSFVTARGWEDLSELIAGYEAMGIPLAEAQVLQFLHSGDAARGFAGYYQLYRKYGQSYSIPEILDGTLEDAAPQVEMARRGAMDERFTVVNLTLDCLNGLLARYEQTDRKVTALHQALSSLKLFLRDRQDMACLEEFIRGRRTALDVKQSAGLLSGSDRETEEWVLRRLEDDYLTIKAEHIREISAGLARIKERFGLEVSARAVLVEDVKAQLERAFAFIAECFGEGHEMILFVSALARMERAMDFISLHGCGGFLRYSRKLLYQERETELRTACASALEDA